MGKNVSKSNSTKRSSKMSDSEYIRQFSLNTLDSRSSDSSLGDSSSCTTATSYSSFSSLSD